ncbi:MAG TPA: tetratricopeptide repeat protein, partial [Tepidisphaeraceae bacterium]|nr:tetratricopeptide repeat protein [Tepidisphaeraceae bacterium]
MITKQMACVWSLGILGGTVALAEATGTNSASTAPATAAVNLLPNGDFQQVTAAGGLAGWTPDQWLTYKVLDDGDGNRFARFTTTAPAQFPAAHHELPLDPACVRLTVAARTRAAATRGREAWHYPRVEVQFTGPDGQKVPVADGHPVIEVTGGKADQWADRSVHVAVPPGAARLRLGMGIWGAVGTADFDDLRVVPRYLGDDAKAGEPPQVPLSARQLLDAGRHDEAAALAERQLLLAAGAGRPDLVEDLAKLRARALRLGGKPQEALAAAKRY